MIGTAPVLPTQRMDSGGNARLVATLRRFSTFPIMIGVFLAAYVTWRITDVFFTLSDGLFVLGAFLLLCGGGLQIRPFGIVTAYWMLAVTLMLFGLFVGSIVNGDPVRWLIAALQYGFSLVVLPCILMGGSDNKQNILLIKALIAGVFCMELFGAIVYYGYPGTYEDYQKIGTDFITGGRRLGAFLAQANWNAAVITMTLPFVFYLGSKKHISILLAGVICCVLVLGLVLSASFTGFTSAMVVIIISILIGGTRKAFVGAGLMAIAVTALFSFGYQLPEVFNKRVAGAIETGDMSQAGTFTGRMDLMHEAWSIVDNTMIVGLGVDQYKVVSSHGMPVHNMYLLLWAEGGLMALFGWLLMIVIAGLSALRVYRSDRQATALALSVLATFIIFSMASPHMYARVWMVPLMLAMAVVVSKFPSRNKALL